MKNKFGEAIGLVITGLVVVIIIAAITAYPIKWIWNWLATDLFGLRAISALEALGLSVLSGLLFGTKSGSKVSEKKDSK